MTLSPHKITAVLLLGITIGGVASAAEHTGRFTVKQEIRSDDNVRIASETKTDVTIYELRPGFSYEIEGETWGLNLDSELEFQRFSNSDFDSDNQFFDAGWEYRGERNNLTLDASLTRDNTLRSEVETAGVFDAERKRSVSVRPGWRHTFSQRNQLEVSLGFATTEYDTPGLNDYETTSANATWTHVLSERSSAQVTVFGSNFVSDARRQVRDVTPGAKRESDTLGAQLGLVHSFSERWSGQFYAGVRDVETVTDDLVCDFPIQVGNDIICAGSLVPVTSEDTSSGEVAGVNLDYAGERFDLGIDLSRGINPSGNGLLLQRDQFAIDLSYEIAEYLRGLLTAQFYDNSAANQDVTFEREYWIVNAGLRWQMNQHWWLAGGVRLRQQKFDQVREGESTMFYVGLDYRQSPMVF